MRQLVDSGRKDRRESTVLYKVADPGKHFARLGEQLCRARERGNRTLCDLEIRVGEENEFIHSLVGSVHSNFIRDVVNEKLKPPFVIDLPGLCPKSVFKIMNWMYRGEVELPWKQIGDHLMVTGRLEIPVLHCQLEEQLRSLAAKNEHRANCVNIATDSRYFVSSTTKTAILALTTKEIGNFSTSDLDKLSTNSIKAMVGDADVSFDRKLDILNFMLHWLRCNRYHLLDEVLPHVRVPCLQHEESAFVSHLRRLIMNSDANERKNLHVYSDDGKRLIVSLDPKKFVKNSGVIVPKVGGDEQNDEISSTEVENSASCAEVYKVLGRYDFDASDLKELQNLPDFGKEEPKKTKNKVCSKPNAFPVETSSCQSRSCKPKTKSKSKKKKACKRSNNVSVTRSPSVNPYDEKSEKSAKTVGRFDRSEKEVEDIGRLPSITSYSDANLIRGNRAFRADEVREMQRVPDCFVSDAAARDRGISVEVLERTSQTIGRNAFPPKEVEDMKRLPPIEAYPDARVIRGRRGFTQDEISEVKQVPDVFVGGSVSGSTFGPSSETFNSFKNYPSICDPNYGKHGLGFNSVRAPSNVSSYVSTAREPDLSSEKEKSTKTIGRFDFTPTELSEIREIPRIDQYSDARVKRGFTPEEIRELNRVPNCFNDSYTRHWVENGRNKQYSASDYYSNRPESVMDFAVGPSTGTYDSYQKYPSFAGSDYNPKSVGFDCVRAPHGATIHKGMYGSQSVADINSCPSICSHPYGRAVPVDRTRESLLDARMIPDPFNSYVAPLSSANGSSMHRYRIPDERSSRARQRSFERRHRTPSEDSLATSADLRDIPDVFGRSRSSSRGRAPCVPNIPTPEQSISSDYWKRPRTPSVASTPIVYPDFGSSTSTVDSTKDIRTQGKFLASKSEIEDIARLPAITDSNPALRREMPPSELSNLRRSRSRPAVQAKDSNSNRNGEKSASSNYGASGFGKVNSVHVTTKQPASVKKDGSAKKEMSKKDSSISENKEKPKANSVYLKPSNEPKKNSSTYMFLK